MHGLSTIVAMNKIRHEEGMKKHESWAEEVSKQVAKIEAEVSRDIAKGIDQLSSTLKAMQKA